jgi:Hemerythrin HHE cation binding domain
MNLGGTVSGTTKATPGTAEQPVNLELFLLVHAALRRDLGALARAIGRADSSARRGRALGRYGQTMLWRLEHHHHGEDAKVWPLLRAKAPDAAALLDELESEHEQLDTAAADARRALDIMASRRRAGPAPAAPAQAASALAALYSSLGSHLDKEERDVLPLLGQRVTAREWVPVDQFYVRTLGLRKLPGYIPWLSSAASPQLREQLLATQPLAFRLIEVLTRPGYARWRRRHGLAA